MIMKRNILALLALPLTLACAEPRAAAERDANANGAAANGPSATGGVAATAATERAERGVVLFLGTSLTAGYGVGVEQAYPALIQAKIDSAGLPFRVSNAGLSGETSAGGLRRLDWSLQEPIDVLVLELGANDGLRGLDVGALRANLDSILTRTKRRYPDAGLVVLGMEAPPNMGPEYTREFRETFRAVARAHDATLVPFLLEGVAARPALNQEDRIHPNSEGHRVMAETVWEALLPILEGKGR